MYFKITNQSSNIYKRLRSIRENEIRIERENRTKVESLLGFKITSFVGSLKQCSFERVTTYSGFVFPDGITPNPEEWRPLKKYEGVFIPNRRTKAGRDIYNQLCSLEKSISPYDIWKIVEVDNYDGSFSFPRLYLCGETILIYLDEQQTPHNNELIEITKSEFVSILHRIPEHF